MWGQNPTAKPTAKPTGGKGQLVGSVHLLSASTSSDGKNLTLLLTRFCSTILVQDKAVSPGRQGHTVEKTPSGDPSLSSAPIIQQKDWNQALH